MFPRLDHSDVFFPNKEVTVDEIQSTLFYMTPLKALGSDGFHAFFFQSQCDLVGKAVFERVQNVFAGQSIDSELNNTLLVLIPKITNLESFAHFCPLLIGNEGNSQSVQSYLSKNYCTRVGEIHCRKEHYK